jgi:hypothetical protein
MCECTYTNEEFSICSKTASLKRLEMDFTKEKRYK